MKYHFTYEIKAEINAANKVEATRAMKKILPTIITNGKLECNEEDIMDDSNAHNKKLVEYTNLAYNQNKRLFNIIVNALALRDMHECEEKNILTPVKEGNEYDYLMHVADDEDLKTIITFVRPLDENGKMIFPF